MLAANPSLVLSVLSVLLLALLFALHPTPTPTLAAVAPQIRTPEPPSDQMPAPPVYTRPAAGSNLSHSAAGASRVPTAKDIVHPDILSQGKRNPGSHAISETTRDTSPTTKATDSEGDFNPSPRGDNNLTQTRTQENISQSVVSSSFVSGVKTNGIVHMQQDSVSSDKSDSNGNAYVDRIDSNVSSDVIPLAPKTSSREVFLGEKHSQTIRGESITPSASSPLKQRNKTIQSSDIKSFNSSLHANTDEGNTLFNADYNSVERNKRAVREPTDPKISREKGETRQDIPQGLYSESSLSKAKKNSELSRDNSKLTGYWEKRNQQNANRSGKESKGTPVYWSEDIQVGCRELRARRYITDGFCTSEKAIKEVVCAGHCLPIKDMPWYAEFVKTIARHKLRDWQCVEDVVRKKRVKLLCQDAEYRYYRIKVVKSCKCKRMTRRHNRPGRVRRKRRKKRKGKRRTKKQKPKSSS